MHGLGHVAWQYLAITQVWVQSQANPGGRKTAQGSTNFHGLSRINSNKTEHSTLARELPRQCLSPPLLGIALETIKTMAFLEPLLELLRLQQCYQSVHGFGSLHLLSQDENEDEHKHEHHDHDHPHDHDHDHDHDHHDDDDDDDAAGGGGDGGGDGGGRWWC